MEDIFLKKWSTALLKFPLKDSHPVDKYLTDGIFYLENKEYEKAYAEFKKAEALDRRFAEPFCTGIALFHLERHKEAIAEFKKTLRLAPDDIVPRRYLASLYQKTGNLRAMRQEGEKVLAYFSPYQSTSRKKKLGPIAELEPHISIDSSRRTITFHE
jgi:tetratricopeptide (TPR) repeat protein